MGIHMSFSDSCLESTMASSIALDVSTADPVRGGFAGFGGSGGGNAADDDEDDEEKAEDVRGTEDERDKEWWLADVESTGNCNVAI
jgi:hypothetical protein